MLYPFVIGLLSELNICIHLSWECTASAYLYPFVLDLYPFALWSYRELHNCIHLFINFIKINICIYFSWDNTASLTYISICSGIVQQVADLYPFVLGLYSELHNICIHLFWDCTASVISVSICSGVVQRVA